ncbi:MULTISPECIES: glycosyltransferase [Pseudonocardia]|jgi:polyene glycosyltransferase|nr:MULTISPECIES: glycosyltransferase [Pseudonocardia]MCO7194241.1 glycosyltransferase [Pseudonocardia sp. McavD-2-B]MYW70675.1 glycosyltransferase [Pseudonocardia sp. SID8383]NYG00173.1 polyene glycosyltransferase [Pseudonocardia antarctica]OJG07799.1 UDP-glucoronosyl and UDP-glucosyl transferase [Pseudonocardia autotrophica]
MGANRRPILFVSYAESGLLNPLLVLAGELSRREVGDLYFAADEKARDDVAGASTGSPVTFASLGDTVSEMSAVTWDDETYAAVTQRDRFRAHAAVIRHSFAPESRIEKYRALERVVDEVRPALMVIESMCQYGYELAITKGIPFVLGVPFVPSNVLTSHVPFARSYTPSGFPVPHSGLPATMTLRQKIANQLFRIRTLGMFVTKETRKVVERDDAVRAELGIAPEARQMMARIDHAEQVLCYSVPELDYPFELPERMRLVGTMVPPLPQVADGGELTDWLDAQSSVVYMGFGTITRLTRPQVASLVEVARRLDARGHQVLWKLPREQQEMLPPATELPAGLRIESWVPSQLDVLAHPSVKVFFTHAGGNGYHEGLYFGKPLVVRPLWVDCDDQAIRGQDFGVSLTVDHPETVDTDDVLDKVTRVLETPAFTERAARMGRLLHEAGGRAAAADLILRLPVLAGTDAPAARTA